MLEDPRGCDAEITPNDFTIQFGWNFGPHHYLLSTAPGIASYLLDRAEPRFVELLHACRHCGVVPERYRVLLDGGWFASRAADRPPRSGSRARDLVG